MKFNLLRWVVLASFVWVLVSSLFLFSACDGGSANNHTVSDTGALHFRAVFHGSDDSLQPIVAAAAVDCAAHGLTTIEAAVYDRHNLFLVNGGPWECDAGQGAIEGVPAGSTRTVVILGKNDEGDLVFRGQKSNVDVEATVVNQVGAIDCIAFVPDLLAPVDGAVVSSGVFGLAWSMVPGAASYRVIISENSDLSEPITDEVTSSTSFAASGLTEDRSYYWRVVASDPYDHIGIPSQTSSFSISADHVNAPPVVQISHPDDGRTHVQGDAIVFSGSGSDDEDGDLTGVSLVWDSDLDGRIGTGETFSTHALSVGGHKVTLTGTDSGGASGTALVAVTINEPLVNEPPIAHINTPDDGSTSFTGDAIAFSGSGSDDEDGNLDGTSLVWRSDLDGQIGTGESLLVANLSAGSHQISLTATDSGGATGIGTIAITVKELLSGRVPDPGQVTSYTETFGEDSDYTINPLSYTKLDASANALDTGASDWVMIRDNVTGLIWEAKSDDGGIHDKDTTYSYPDARDVFIAQLNSDAFGGYTDWRLPSIKELHAIVHKDQWYPAISTDYFLNTAWVEYWSATTAQHSGSVWYQSFARGDLGLSADKPDYFRVRAVRGQQSNASFVDNGDGTVTDTTTGLMWQSQSMSCFDWPSALMYCEALELGGYDDWRLPNINELQSIVDYDAYDPAIDEGFFPFHESSGYWSSTSYVDIPSSAWYVDFTNGNIGYQSKSTIYQYVHAVRGGQ